MLKGQVQLKLRWECLQHRGNYDEITTETKKHTIACNTNHSVAGKIAACEASINCPRHPLVTKLQN